MNQTTDGPISVALETSGASGSVAVGRGDELRRTVEFPAHSRHATQLIVRLDELLSAESLRPADIDEVYVSAGPGSFTGLRIAITVARTLAQAVGGIRCVSVPTAAAVAENVADREWVNLAVVLPTKNELFHATLFRRSEEGPEIIEPARVATLPEILADAPRPVLLLSPGRIESDIPADVTRLDGQSATPAAGGVWQAGRRLARRGRYTEPLQLLPIYVRRPEAVRLWEKRHGKQDG